MMSFAQWGNALYSGKKSYGIIPRRKLFVSLAGGLMVLSGILIAVLGLNPSIEFTGGSQFSVTGVSSAQQQTAYDAVASTGLTSDVRVSNLGQNAIRVQTPALDTERTDEVRQALASAYDVDVNDVQASSIGPTWGHDVTTKALQSLVIFLVLVAGRQGCDTHGSGTDGGGRTLPVRDTRARRACGQDPLVVLTGALAAVLEHDEERRRDEDRGVGAHDHADEECQRDVGQRPGPQEERPDEQDRPDGEQCDDRGVDRADHGLVDREVDELTEGVALLVPHALGELTHLVEDHDGVVEGVTQDRQVADEGGR